MNKARAYLQPRWAGIGVSVSIALVAYAIQTAEQNLFKLAIIEGLVVAIVLGMVWRNAVGVSKRLQPGISFVAKEILEFAVMLLGASVNLPALFKEGVALFVVIVLVVLIGLVASRALGNLFGLNPRLATLIAVGNSICGNSAIAAVAPIIKAEPDDIAASIAFTAVLGVVVVLVLPFLMLPLAFNEYEYGVIAGLSVYAVPQVVAAAAQVGTLALKVATAVKLVRVLMLGPVVLFFTLRQNNGTAKLSLNKLVPWFIIGFIVLALLRSINIIPQIIGDQVVTLGKYITIASMAALGLGVDFNSLRKAGGKVTLVVIGSLIVMLVTSTVFIKLFNI